jgi:hypothetical protein
MLDWSYLLLRQEALPQYFKEPHKALSIRAIFPEMGLYGP